MALFSSAQYYINSTKIEAIDNDIAITITGLARYSDDFIKSAGHSMMFTKDITDNADNNPLSIGRPRNDVGNADADV